MAPTESTRDAPEPEHVIKLSAAVGGGGPWSRRGGGRLLWRGRLLGGGEDRSLAGTWVRANFKAPFLHSVISKRGRFVHVPIVGPISRQYRPLHAVSVYHRDEPEVLIAPTTGAGADTSGWPLKPKAVGPELTSQTDQQGAALYGLASAVHHYSDRAAAAAIAACAAPDLAGGDAFGHVCATVRSEAAGWGETPLTDHDPHATHVPDESQSCCSWLTLSRLALRRTRDRDTDDRGSDLRFGGGTRAPACICIST